MTWAPRSFQRRMALARDGAACRYCGRKVYPAHWLSAKDWLDIGLTFDHFFPRYYRGPSEVWNLFVSCYLCNAAKRNATPGEVVRQDGRLVKWTLIPAPTDPVELIDPRGYPERTPWPGPPYVDEAAA